MLTIDQCSRGASYLPTEFGALVAVGAFLFVLAGFSGFFLAKGQKELGIASIAAAFVLYVSVLAC